MSSPLDDDGDERICIMLYADGIILIGVNERDLQAMLDELSVWCERNHMQVKHFTRTPRRSISHLHLAKSIDREI